MVAIGFRYDAHTGYLSSFSVPTCAFTVRCKADNVDFKNSKAQLISALGRLWLGDQEFQAIWGNVARLPHKPKD